MDECRTLQNLSLQLGQSWQLCPCISSFSTSSMLSPVEWLFQAPASLMVRNCSFLSCVYSSALSTTLQAPSLPVLMDVPELYIISSSAYPLWHWPRWVCSSAWFDVIISSLMNINTSFPFFLLSLVSVLASVGITPVLVLPQGTSGNDTQRQLHLALVPVRR